MGNYAGFFSPAIFDPGVEFLPGVKTSKRGYANVLAVRGVWLDFDGGDLDHEGLARVLPRHRIVAFNTHSNTRAERRWRAFLPTDGPMSVAVHRHILSQLVHALTRHGWVGEEESEGQGHAEAKGRHGLDGSKTAATSLFYLPSQAAAPGASFFVDHDGPERRPLDLARMVDRSVVHDRPEAEATPARAVVGAEATTALPDVRITGDTSPRMAKLREALAARGVMDRRDYWTERAIEEWMDVPSGRGNARFCRLGLRLRAAGWDLPDVSRPFEEQVRHARTSQSRVDRRDQIPSILDWLRQNPRRHRRPGDPRGGAHAVASRSRVGADRPVAACRGRRRPGVCGREARAGPARNVTQPR